MIIGQITITTPTYLLVLSSTPVYSTLTLLLLLIRAESKADLGPLGALMSSIQPDRDTANANDRGEREDGSGGDGDDRQSQIKSLLCSDIVDVTLSPQVWGTALTEALHTLR